MSRLRTFFVVVALIVPSSAGLANHHYRPPSPPPSPPTQHRPPVINRPPIQQQQQILQQQRLRSAAQQRAAAREQLTFGAVDDKISRWDDFAALSEAELAVLFAELVPEVDSFDRNAIKAQMSADLDAAGAPADAKRQILAGIDPLINQIEAMIGGAQKSYPADMAREFKQIYAANCCGEAQFIQALGAAETKVANKFRADLATRMGAQSGLPPGAAAMIAGGIGGGTTVVTYGANDPTIQAARGLVMNGGGTAPAPTPVATGTGGTTPAPAAVASGGGATPPAPAAVATGTGGGPTVIPPATKAGGGGAPTVIAANPAGGGNGLPTGGLLTPLPAFGQQGVGGGVTGQLPGGSPNVASVSSSPIGGNGSGGDRPRVAEINERIVALGGQLGNNPANKDAIIAELRGLVDEGQTLPNFETRPLIEIFWAGDASKLILDYTEDGIDVAKVTVVGAACLGSGGAACAGVVAVEEGFKVIDPIAGALGNAIDNYNEKVNSGDSGGFGTAFDSTVSGAVEQFYEETGKILGGKLTNFGEFSKKIGEEIVKRVGKAIYSGDISVERSSGGSSHYDSSASLGSAGAGGSVTTNSGQVYQR